MCVCVYTQVIMIAELECVLYIQAAMVKRLRRECACDRINLFTIPDRTHTVFVVSAKRNTYDYCYASLSKQHDREGRAQQLCATSLGFKIKVKAAYKCEVYTIFATQLC